MELLRYWHQQGPDAPQIDFLATSGNPGVYDDEARALGAGIFYLRCCRHDIASFTWNLREILRRGTYTAIHDHQDFISGWHFLMGAGLLPRVCVTHVHGAAYQVEDYARVKPTRRFIINVGKHLISRFSTHITGTSRQMITEYGFDSRRFEHIPKGGLYCGFHPSRFLGDVGANRASVCAEFGWPEDAQIILFVGRIDQSPDEDYLKSNKNSGFAVSVGLECASRDTRVRLLLAGALSPAVPVLEQRIVAAGFAGRVQFAGVRKDIERLMIASDVLLFPSRGEGLGMVAVEAQAAGLPVLASWAVPRECVVVPELVRFQKLEAGAPEWATELLSLARRPRNILEANKRVAASPFAIHNSAHALLTLYSKGLAN
jgi:glycosyltransferase involved in cell wall biosynthesis